MFLEREDMEGEREGAMGGSSVSLDLVTLPRLVPCRLYRLLPLLPILQRVMRRL